MANELNSYFLQSVMELTKDFEQIEYTNYITQNESVNYFHIKEIQETKTMEMIGKLSNSKTNDIYNMSSSFLKHHCTVLAKPLTHLVNLSIRTCTFPSGWKKGSYCTSI